MNEITKLVLSLSLSGSILSAILFALKPIIKDRLSKKLQYCLWIIVLLRLIIPFSFETSIMNELFYGDSSQLIHTSQIEKQYSVGNGSTTDIDSPNEANRSVNNSDSLSNKYNTEDNSKLNDENSFNNSHTNNLSNEFIEINVNDNIKDEKITFIGVNNELSKNVADLFIKYAILIWLLGVVVYLAANLNGYSRF